MTTAGSSYLPYVESFATIQGEGPAAGQAAVFLRFGGCNLSCSWCDTPYSWDGQRFDLRQQISLLTVDQIIDRLPFSDARVVVVTGGEPLLNQGNAAWPYLLNMLNTRYPELHLETNGVIAPTAATRQAFTLMCVSPKQPHAGDHKGRSAALHPDWVAVTGAVLKIVVRGPADVARAVDTAKAGGWPLSLVWVMPEGMDPGTLNTRWPMIAQAAADHGINATHRLHVLAWGDKRGH